MKAFLAAFLVSACSQASTPPAGAPVTIVRGGVDIHGKPIALAFSAGRWVEVAAGLDGDAEDIDASGAIVVPAFVDSHVHLHYSPVRERLRCSGVAASVDLAAPMKSLAGSDDVLSSGPMLTSPKGYPTQSWGQDGYAWECADEPCVRKAIATLDSKGARVIKLALLGSRGLSRPLARVAIGEAHERGLPVVAHALAAADVGVAAELGVDVLAHTPVEPLPPAIVKQAARMHVISTLAAFESPTTVDNAIALRRAGATFLYGTDLGNLQTTGIAAREIELLQRVGMSRAEIVAAATTAPAMQWKIDDLGQFEVGGRASFLLIAKGAPLAQSLAKPRAVYMDGAAMRCR